MIIMLIGNLCSYYADVVILLCFCIESPFIKIPQEPKIVDFMDSDKNKK